MQPGERLDEQAAAESHQGLIARVSGPATGLSKRLVAALVTAAASLVQAEGALATSVDDEGVAVCPPLNVN
eukprot:11197703-Lingulodinium_polyedra.AAC.1